jgi:hypothetical protein
MLDHQLADERTGADRGHGSSDGTEQQARVACPAECVGDEERDRTEREMHLSGKRDRRERGARGEEPPVASAAGALEGPQGDRDQDRDRPEQVADALPDPVRGDRERQPSRERGSTREIELAEPGARRQPGEDVEQDLQDVPARDEAKRGSKWPEEDPVGPAREVRLRLRLGPECVGITPRSASVLELMPDEPVVVEGLQVVAGRRLAVGGCTPGEELRVCVRDGRPRRRHSGCQVERGAERYIACAARTSSSKSGTSAVS